MFRNHLAWMNVSNSAVNEEVMIASQTTIVDFFSDEATEAVKNGSKLFAIHKKQDAAEIAFASNRSVIICSSKGHIKIRYSVDYDIHKVMWTTFYRTKDDKKDAAPLECLAIIGEQDITFYTKETIQPYTYYVPFKIRNVYQMKHGLLLEQAWTNDEEFRKKQKEHIYLYSLTHPLNELLPVLYRPREFIGQWLFCWEHEELSLVDAFDDLVMVYDRAGKTHRLYHLRHTLAEEIKSSLYFQRNIQMDKRDSTPKGPKFSTPKAAFEVQGVGQGSMSIKTRSMIRLARTRTFPMDSPALSIIGTPPNTMDSTESPTFRLRSATQPSFLSSLGPNMTKILARELNNELLYAEFCLECIWTEASRKDLGSFSAEKAFLSQSLCFQAFVNYFVPEAKQLRCIRLADGDHKTVVQNSFGVVSCLDAVILEKEKHTIVLESERYLTLYSGHTKVCSISYPILLDDGVLSLHTAINDSIFAVSHGHKIAQLEIRPLFGDQLVEDLFTICLSVLSAQDKSNLLSSWRIFNCHADITNQFSGYSCPLLHVAIQWLMRQIGIILLHHPMLTVLKDDIALSSKEGAPQAKVKKPPLSIDEMKRRMESWGRNGFIVRPQDSSVEIDIDTQRPFASYADNLFAAMHAVWQQWGLRSDMDVIREQIMEYLKVCALATKYDSFLDQYEKEFPEAYSNLTYHIAFPEQAIVKKKNPYLENRFILYKTISGLLKSSKDLSRCTSQIFTLSPKIAQLLLAITVGLKTVSHQVDAQRLLGKRWKKLMPSGMENEILKLILSKKLSPEEKSAQLLQLFNFNSTVIDNMPCVIALTIGQIILGNKAAAEVLYPQSGNKTSDFPDERVDARVAALRWPSDKRMENVAEMLRSDKPVLINTSALFSQAQAQTHDERELQEIFLHGTCIRYLAQAFGRGMKDFRACSSIVMNENGVAAPDLNLTARLFPSNMSFEIPITDATRPYREWGEFYNGVAAALRIGHSSHVKLDSEHIISLCVKQDKSQVSTQTAAGMLYGYALNGHVLSSTYHISEMLISMDEFQSVAILLGYGVAKMGTGDLRIYKMLGTQLPCLMGPTSLNVNVPHISQTAAIAALGLLFAQTGNNTLVRKLVNEIGKCMQPEEAPASDRYAYRLNAGFAVGLVNLGQGNELLARQMPFMEEQPSIIERLIHMINGHPRKLCVFPPEPILINDCPHYMQPPPSCHVREKDTVNIHLAGNGACVALGMMFLQSNNKTIADRIALPNTIAELEKIKPDLIMTRVLCYNLIMWDSIQPTVDFIQKSVPSNVEEYLRTEKKMQNDDEHLSKSEFKYIVDFESLCQVWCYCIAGTCMAIGIRFKNAPPEQKHKAHEAILFFLRQFVPSSEGDQMQDVFDFAGLNVTSQTMNTMLTSLGILMAGSGDLESIRMARIWRINESVISWMRSPRKHQEQVAAHELLGLVFMGNGRYAFKEDLLSNALILMSFFPQVCHGVNDSRFYHQPLRFLWTQAVEERLLVPYSKSKDPQPCDVTVTYNDNITAKFSAPCIIPPLDMVSHVLVSGKGLESATFDLKVEKQKQELSEILFVFHGKFKLLDGLRDTFTITDSDFYIKLPQFDCNLPVDDWDEDSKQSRIAWPVMETTPAMKNHVRALETILLSCLKKRIIFPEVEYAAILANWAGEDALAFSLELAMDKAKYLDATVEHIKKPSAEVE